MSLQDSRKASLGEMISKLYRVNCVKCALKYESSFPHLMKKKGRVYFTCLFR
jgi:hypothetical protein